MSDIWLLIICMSAATLTIRVSGVVLGQRLPRKGPWARALNALPGCLIISLVTVLLLSGGPNEWIAGGIAALVTLATKNLPLTMLAGIIAILTLRTFL